MSTAAPYRAASNHLLVRVRLTPRGGADRIDGVAILADGSAVLLAHVRAAPEDGKANAALVAMIAKALGVAKSSATIVAGETSRVKELRIDGDASQLLGRAAALWPVNP